MSSDQRDLETKIQVGIGFVVVLVIFFVISWLGNKTPTEIKNQKEDVIAQQKIEAPTSEPRYSSSTKMGRVKEILKPYPDSFYAYPGDPSFKAPPDDYNGPIDIVIIDTTASTCDAAKTLAYDLYKSIFSDPVLKGSVNSVKISELGFVNSRLDKLDGEGLERTGSWSGPTNFYTVLFRDFEATSNQGQGTWVQSVRGCR